jgi:hypothetical protein
MYLSTKTTFKVLAVFACLLFYSCQKDVDSKIQEDIRQHVLETEDETVIKVGQAIAINDGTALSDSASFVNPPTNRYYEWHILPNSGCVTVWGKYKYGKANITFNCSGRYQVSAAIYDSATRKKIATTDTMQIEVTKDTLQGSQPLHPTDVLWLQAQISKGWSDQAYATGSPADKIFLSFGGKTAESYEEFDWGNRVPVSYKQVGSYHTFVFSDSVKLSSYPFARYRSYFRPVNIALGLQQEIKPGIPVNLSITWLGSTYEGKLTLLDEDRYTVDWDNSGNVKIK